MELFKLAPKYGGCKGTGGMSEAREDLKKLSPSALEEGCDE